MSDSEDDRLPDVPKAPRQKRFKFKTFSERVAEVEVDVYRQLAPVKTEPSSGSWLADGLAQWRELNSAAHFLQTAAELQPLCQTLPQLLHHRESIARILLASLEPAARLSLPALLDLLAAFARDLQQEFLAVLPRAVRRIVQLLDGGAEREPESLEAIFTCVSHICKHLVRHLAVDLPAALRVTAPLRYHSADYVRQFAAQAVGFLLRSAPSPAALKSGVRAVLAEQAVRPTEERTDGAGLVLAEAVLGISHGLHSRAPQLLQLLLKEDLLQPSDLRPATPGHGRKGTSAARVDAADTAAAAAAATHVTKTLAAAGVSQEQMRARATAVARVALARLLDHLRRDKAGELWTALLAETTARLKSFEGAAAAGATSPVAAAGAGATLSAHARATGRSLGRVLLLLAQAIGYFRGSRVVSYAPLMDLITRLMHPAVWSPTSAAAAEAAVAADGIASPGSSPSFSPSPSPGVSPEAAASREAGGSLTGLLALGREGVAEDEDEDEDLLDVSLSYAVLEYVRSVVYGHLKAVGASEGPEALARVAVSLSPCFSRPPAREVLPFVKSLMVPPAGAAIARVFAAPMMGALGRVLMQRQQHQPGGNPAATQGAQPLQQRPQQGHGWTQKQPGESLYPGAALLLLRDLCILLAESGGAGPAGAAGRGPGSGLPLLLTAQPHGVRLAAYVRGLATQWTAKQAAADERVGGTAWAAVSLLPHACESTLQAVTACEQVLQTTTAVLQRARDSVHAESAGGARASDAQAGLLLLRATAVELLAELLQRQQQAGLSVSLVAAAESTLEWVLGGQRHKHHTKKAVQAHHKDRGQVEGHQEEEEDGRCSDADFASIRAAGALLAAVRDSVASSGAAGGMGSGAILSQAQALLSGTKLREAVLHLAPLLASESQPLRAAVLRLLCCFDQPSLEALGPDPNDPTAGVGGGKKGKREAGIAQGSEGSSGKGGAAGPTCDLLEVLHGINSQAFTIESGRKWAVAIGRLKTYLEYDRIPEFLVPSFVYGLVGVLHIRFSPLWQPASEAMAACLQFRAKESWPIVFAFLASSERQLLAADFPSAPAAVTHRHGRHRSGAALSAAITAAPLEYELPASQDASVIESLEDRYSSAVNAGTPQAAGGVTDPQNRLSHVLRAMAAAPYSTIEKFSRDWVPLFLDYTAARGSHFDDGEGDVEALVAAAKAASEAAATEVGAGVKGGDGAAEERPHKKARVGEAGCASVGGEEAEEPGMRERRRSHTDASSSGTADPAVATPDGGKRKGAKGAKGKGKGKGDKKAQKEATAAAEATAAPPACAAAVSVIPVGAKRRSSAAKYADTDAEEEGPAAVAAAGGGGRPVSVLSRIGGKTWRAGLLDWLKLLAGLHGVRGLHRSEELQRAVSSHLLEADSAIQVATLRCLRPYRFRWLPTEMADRLGRLADDATLREELAIFPIAPGSDGGVGEEARPGLIPLLIRVLFPKMRKRSGRLGGRGAPGSARAAILNFLANLRPAELRPLLELLLEPMAAAFAQPPAVLVPAPALRAGGAATEAAAAELDRYRLLPPPWWSAPVLGRGVGWWLAAVDQTAVEALPPRRKVGFLNAFEDLLSHLGHAVEPFLPVLLAITMRLLISATAGIPVTSADAAAGAAGASAGGAEAVADGAAAPPPQLGSGKTLLKVVDQDQKEAEQDVSEDEGPEEAEQDDEEKEDEGKVKAASRAATGAAAGGAGAYGQEAAEEGEEDEEEGAAGDGTATGAAASAAGGAERHREVRSAALRLLAQVWLRFPASSSTDYNELWGLFLPAVRPLIPRLQFEAASTREPPLLECVLSLSLSPGLVRVLADLPSIPDATLPLVRPASSARAAAGGAAAAAAGATGVPELVPMDVDENDESEAEWRMQGLGSALMRGAVNMLSSGRCTEVVRATVLDVLDSVLGCSEALLQRVLLPWLADVLRALNTVIAESWQQAGPGRGPRGGSARRRSSAQRELAILERLGGYVGDVQLAASLADSLVALLAQAGARGPRQRGGGKGGRLDEHGISRALAALAALWGRLQAGDLPGASVERYCETMSMWAIRLTSRDARSQLAAAYGAVARLLPRLDAPAALLTDLTAWSQTSLDDVDYDRRLAAYGKLTSAAAWSQLDRLQALPLLLVALYDIRNAADLALRQAASAALGSCVEAMAAADAAAAAAAEAAPLASDGLLGLLMRVLYPQLKTQLSSPSLAVRQEHLALLRAVVVAMPHRFPELATLLSDDAETDFFNNIAHLQSHRRTRALVKLAKILRAQRSPSNSIATNTTSSTAAADDAPQPSAVPLSRCLMDVITPLVQQFIEEAAGVGGSTGRDVRAHDKKQSDVDKEANVTDAAVSALGAIAGLLAWPQYEHLLNQFIRLMRARSAKPLIRAVCAILDNFHFALPEAAEEEGPAQPGVEAPAAEGMGNGDGDAAAAAKAAEAAAVQRVLLGRILPALHEQLVERKRGEDEEAASVRAPVALALVKLLKLLPPAAERAELPRALQGVTNLLRSRPQRVRDDARAVLVSMMAELGPRYVPYACHVLKASLPDRGFTAHVLGYTLHAVLEAVMKVAQGESAAAAAAAAMAEPTGDAEVAVKGYDIDDDDAVAAAAEDEEGVGVGVLDESLELCLPMIEGDLFGEVSEAKEVTAFAAQYKEAKRCHANEAYQLLASGITFATHMRLLLTLVTDRLHLAGQPSVRAKLTQLLQFAARGVRANPTAVPKQVMALVIGVMEGCLTREEAARARAKAAVGPAGSAAVSAAAGLGPASGAAAAAASPSADPAADRAALHETLVLEFCLTLFHNGVKRGALAGRSPELVALLDPALPLLVRALRSRHAGCVSLALKSLAHIVPLPLPQLATEAPNAGRALTALLGKVPNVRHPIAQECFRLLAALLRDCAAYKPTTAQLRFLLRWAFEDLGEAGAQPTAFALLRALLGRRVVLPEVYDVMDRVQQIMVRSQSAPVRSCCSVALLQFLLDFPLGPQRLTQHVAFLLANLEYEYESGRLQVLDMLQQVVTKFPAEVLQAQSDVLLMPLVVRLVNDTSPKARAAAGDVIRSLLGRLEAPQVDKAVAYCRTWLDRSGGSGSSAAESARDASLRRAAAQTLGFVAEVEGSRFVRRLADLAPGVLRILERQAARGVDGSDDVTALDDESADTEAACPGWQEAYYCLLLLEKVAAQAGAALAWPAGRGADKGCQVQAAPAAAASPLAPALWEVTIRLLLHRHMWVRKASARLVGYGLASPRVVGGLMAAVPYRAGQLAFAFFLQLECSEADEATCLQAVKCLVSLSVHLHCEEGAGGDQKQPLRTTGLGADNGGLAGSAGKAGKRARAPRAKTVDKDHDDDDDDGDNDDDDVEEGGDGDEAHGKSNGKAGGSAANAQDPSDEDEEADGEEQAQGEEEAPEADGAAGGDEDEAGDDAVDGLSMAAQVQRRAFTLRGLVRRMARLADDARWARGRQRAAALRWTAAAASALGAAAIAPYLPVLLRPLFRISEAAAAAGGLHSGVPAGGGLGGSAATTSSRVPEEIRELSEEVMAHLRGLVGSEVLLAAYNAAREHVKGARAERKRRTAVRGMLDPAAAAAARLRHNSRKAEGRKRKLELLKRERSAKQLRHTGRRGGKRSRGD